MFRTPLHMTVAQVAHGIAYCATDNQGKYPPLVLVVMSAVVVAAVVVAEVATIAVQSAVIAWIDADTDCNLGILQKGAFGLDGFGCHNCLGWNCNGGRCGGGTEAEAEQCANNC